MAAWFERASPAVLALPDAVFADHDEANGRLVFGVENAAAVRGIETALAAIGVPESAYDVQVTEPIHQVATLGDRFRSGTPDRPRVRRWSRASISCAVFCSPMIRPRPRPTGCR